MIIISDVHIGAARSGGTTPQTAYALRNWLIGEFGRLLDKVDEDLCILGDLFDAHTIPMQDMVRTYFLLEQWLKKGHKLYLVEGNHDLHTDSSKVSSFQAMSQILAQNEQVTAVSEPYDGGWFYIIPHTVNQDLFDLHLKSVPETTYLLVHCNYDNHFAKESDHSLNLSKEQAENLLVKHIIFAHEHHGRKMLGGKVLVVGNQIPSSISDCLGGDKNMLRITENSQELIPTWNSSDYIEVDWRNPTETEARFIRFVGTCPPEEAADMANTVARYRKSSEAFVVGNAVKVEGQGEDTSQDVSLDEIRGFNILQALKEILNEDEVKIVESLNV